MRAKPEGGGRKRRREEVEGGRVEKGTEKREIADQVLMLCTELLLGEGRHGNHFHSRSFWCSGWLIHFHPTDQEREALDSNKFKNKPKPRFRPQTDIPEEREILYSPRQRFCPRMCLKAHRMLGRSDPRAPCGLLPYSSPNSQDLGVGSLPPCIAV